VEIPELIVITPRFLFWRVGAESDEKVAEVVVTDPKTTRLTGLSAPIAFSRATLAGLSGVFD